MKAQQTRLAAECVVLLSLSFAGCVNMPERPAYLTAQESPDFGQVGVVTARFQPNIQFDVLTHATAALPDLKVQEMVREFTIQYVRDMELTGFMVLKDQGPQSLDELPIYHPEPGKSLDTVLEIAVTNVIAKKTSGPQRLPIEFQMTFRARLIQVNGGKVLDSITHNFFAYSEYGDLAKDDAKLLTNVFQPVSREFAENVVDELFLNYRTIEDIYCPEIKQPASDSSESKRAIPDTSDTKGGPQKSYYASCVPDYALQPLYPEVQRLSIFTSEPRSIRFLKFVAVDSLEPTFRWESFPRLKRLSQAKAESRLTDVKYDVRIFSTGVLNTWYMFFGGYQFHEVRGLSEPSYKLGNVLEPCHRYYWTVRARFKLDGKSRATEWSGEYNGKNVIYNPWWWRRDISPSILINPLNTAYYFPFRTPAASPSKICPKG